MLKQSHKLINMMESKKASRLSWLPWLLGLCFISFSQAHSLSVSSKWLVQESNGTRVKLACVNWAGHLEPMLPEGLNRQPLYRIALAVKGLGFNCVRLTWSTYMFTDASLANQTVKQTFTCLNLQSTLKGIAIHNPDLVDLTLIDAFKWVVACLARVGLLIILDNHVSKPQWCCGDKDGNGFWGDSFFDSKSWIEGLTFVASTFKDSPEVVGMSLRNELRGPKQNTQDWFKYMTLGANAVFNTNPKLIIIISGLHFDTDLRLLSKTQLALPFQEKLVYEIHWYTSSYGVNFARGNLNKACAIATSSLMACGGFMTTLNGSLTAPLFVSEFGIDQRGGNEGNNRYINCFFAFMASLDLDWSYWPLQGSYYIRDGREGDEEFFGILNSQWSAPRNISFLARLQAIQQPWQVVDSSTSSKRVYQILFHPASGLCLQKGYGNTLLLGPCIAGVTAHWRYTPQGRLEMVNSYFCVASDGEGEPAKLEAIGTEKNGPWTMASVAKLQFATKIHHRRSSVNNHHHTMAAANANEDSGGDHDDGSHIDDDGNHTDHDDNHDGNHIDDDDHAGEEHNDDDHDDDNNDEDDHNDDDGNHIDDDDDHAGEEHDDDDHDDDHNDDDDHDDDHNDDDDHDDDHNDDGDHDDNDEGDHNDHDNAHHGGHIDMTNELATPQHDATYGLTLCLDGSTPPFVTTKRCICVQDDEMDCGPDDDPSYQWFVFISANSPPSVYSGASKF